MRIGLFEHVANRYYPIKSNRVRVGASEACQVLIDDEGISPLHFEIHITDVGIELHHRATAAETFINDYSATRYFLSNSDRIRFGSAQLEFRISSDQPSRNTLCARCGVELAGDATRRYDIGSARRGLSLCPLCASRGKEGAKINRGSRPGSSHLDKKDMERTDSRHGLRSGKPTGSESDSGSGSRHERKRGSRRLPQKGASSESLDLFAQLERSTEEIDLAQSLEGMPEFMPIATIAKGAQGVLYKMSYKGEIVAVKRLKFERKSRARERYRRECEALRELSHPSLVSLIDSIEHEKSAYLIMEFIDGPSLEALIQREGGLPRNQGLKYALEVAEGLEYLASMGVVHRDIKPSNVLVDAKNRARLVDFGLVRFTQNQRSMLTAAGQIVGTPFYMSPEQIRAKELTAKSDVFSFAVTFYEALCGRRPFPGANPMELFNAILEDEPRMGPLKAKGADLVAAFELFFNKDPEKRPTPAEMVLSIRTLLAAQA